MLDVLTTKLMAIQGDRHNHSAKHTFFKMSCSVRQMHACTFTSPFCKKSIKCFNRVCVHQSCLKTCLLKCSSGLGTWFSGRGLDYHAQGPKFNSQHHGGG